MMIARQAVKLSWNASPMRLKLMAAHGFLPHDYHCEWG